jgi:hypothetical protein
MIYDNKNITRDGTGDVSNASKDISEKMRATGLHDIDMLDGHSNRPCTPFCLQP